jgi:hypothetical protein
MRQTQPYQPPVPSAQRSSRHKAVGVLLACPAYLLNMSTQNCTSGSTIPAKPLV